MKDLETQRKGLRLNFDKLQGAMQSFNQNNKREESCFRKTNLAGGLPGNFEDRGILTRERQE